MIEPLVCVPIAAGAMPQATAAADPLEEPPGCAAEFQGLRVLDGTRKANSVVTVLPMAKAPAACSRSTTSAFCSGT